MSKHIKISEDEMSMLTLSSRSSRQGAHYAFGPGWLGLLDIPENQWALDLLAEFRHEGEIPTTAHHEALTQSDGLAKPLTLMIKDKR